MCFIKWAEFPVNRILKAFFLQIHLLWRIDRSNNGKIDWKRNLGGLDIFG